MVSTINNSQQDSTLVHLYVVSTCRPTLDTPPTLSLVELGQKGGTAAKIENWKKSHGHQTKHCQSFQHYYYCHYYYYYYYNTHTRHRQSDYIHTTWKEIWFSIFDANPTKFTELPKYKNSVAF